MNRQPPTRAPATPFVAAGVLVAVVVIVLVPLLEPRPRTERPRPSAAAPPVVVNGRPTPAATRPPVRAVAAGRRFLALYARFETRPLTPSAANQLRSLTSLALAQTLLAQPPVPAGGSRTDVKVARIRPETLSAHALLLHVALRAGASLTRLRCLVQRDRGRWTVTALTATR